MSIVERMSSSGIITMGGTFGTLQNVLYDRLSLSRRFHCSTMGLASCFIHILESWAFTGEFVRLNTRATIHTVVKIDVVRFSSHQVSPIPLILECWNTIHIGIELFASKKETKYLYRPQTTAS